jgi:solute carrier family 25 (mitochondrial aspartate/glutamate transporter), member 12/13
MDQVESIIRQAVTKSKDGRITRTDFLNAAAQTTRYGIFSPMEVSIIFHFAGASETNKTRGTTDEKRLTLKDFAQVCLLLRDA